MALCSSQLQKLLLNRTCCNHGCSRTSRKNIAIVKGGGRGRSCSASAINAPSSLASASAIKWGSVKLKGAREEMEDDVVIIQSDGLHGFSFAAIFDGHSGFSGLRKDNATCIRCLDMFG